jgi:hypothetical protein
VTLKIRVAPPPSIVRSNLPGPVIVTARVILIGAATASVPVTPIMIVTVASGDALPCATASGRLPGPLSFRLMTVKVPAVALAAESARTPNTSKH